MVFVALAMPVLLGFLGLGIDVGYLRYTKRQIQMAADAAAIAGAIDLSKADVVTAGQSASAENGFKNGAAGVTVNIYTPPNDGPHAGVANYVEAVVTDTQVPVFFSKIFGAKPVTLSGRAVAQGNTNCIYGLDSSAGNSTLNLQLLDLVNSPCGVVSNANINAGIATGLCATSIELVGSVTGIDFFGLCQNGQNTDPSPGTKLLKPVSDPLASLPAPTPSAACSGSTAASTTYTGNGSTINIPAGNYCGGISIVWGTGRPIINFTGGTYTIGGSSKTISPGLQIAEGSQVTFNGGTYTLNGGMGDVANSNNFDTINFNASGSGNPALFILNGGGLTLLATLATGSGVTFYNTGTSATYGPVNVIFALGSLISAPTSGTYAGIHYFQDRNNPQTATFAANLNFGSGNNPAVEGAYYFPDATVSFDFDFGANAPYSILVANQVKWLVSFTFNADYSSLPNNASPLPVGNAVLAE
jgi:hypothetical protein